MLANFSPSSLNIDGSNNDSSGTSAGGDSGSGPNSQMGGGGAGVGNNAADTKDTDSKRNQQPPYMMPGVLHYLQYEWNRYELERSQWEMERAELKARISFLIGERKAQENLKHDLVRRIKMLEYALKQERTKFQQLLVSYEQLQNGQATTGDKEDMIEQTIFQPNIHKSTVPLDIDAIIPPTPSPPAIIKSDSNSSKQHTVGGEITNQEWAKARETLRHYLQEIGYTKKILDVRSFRVKHLLGLLPDSKQFEDEDNSGNRIENTERALLDTEQAILETANAIKKLRCGAISGEKQKSKLKSNTNEDYQNVDDDDNSDSSSGGDVADAFNLNADTAEAFKEFSFLRKNTKEDSNKNKNPCRLQQEHDYNLDVKAVKEKLRNEKRQQSVIASTPAKPGGAGCIDDCSGSSKFNVSTVKPTRHISVDTIYGIPPNTIPQQSQQTTDFTFEEEKFERIKETEDDDEQHLRWNIRYTLRSHYDSICAMQFHPVDHVLITASEDGTAKLWDLNHLSASGSGGSKSGSGSGSDGSGKASQFPQPATGIIDIEPLYTFRGHRGPILAIDMNPFGDSCYTAGLDGVICCWKVPSTFSEDGKKLELDIYQSFDASVLRERLCGHEDAIWGLSYHAPSNRIISASADGTIKIWIVGLADGAMPSPLLKTITELDRPRSIDLSSTESQHLAVACSRVQCYIRDFETGQIVLKFQMNENGDDTPLGEVNKIISHPTLPITITAGEDRKIRFFDNNSGKLIYSTMAHMEGVSTLAIDSNGHYILSGSHDGSIRLWDAEKRVCLQEIAAHRKKLSSGVMALAFHPTRPLIGSAGADSLAKVYGPLWNSPKSPLAPTSSSPSSSSGSSGPSSLVNSPQKPQQQQIVYSRLKK